MSSDNHLAVVLSRVSKSFTRPPTTLDPSLDDDQTDDPADDAGLATAPAVEQHVRPPRHRRLSLGRTAWSAPVVAIDDVSFEVHAGEGVALLGPKSSGKTTLLRLISGVYSPDTGHVKVAGRVGGSIGAGAGRSPDLTLRDNAVLQARLLGVGTDEAPGVATSALQFAALDGLADTRYRVVAPGVQRRLELAVAVHSEPGVFLADGDLLTGRGSYRQALMQEMTRLRRQGCTFVIVAHQRDRLRQLCERALLLIDGSIVFDGALRAGLAELDRRQQP